MEQHKFRVEVGEYMGGSGAWISSTSKVFDTVIACNSANDGRNMLEAQWCGPDKVRVSWMGPA
jgi:hypothetical protein